VDQPTSIPVRGEEEREGIEGRGGERSDRKTERRERSDRKEKKARRERGEVKVKEREAGREGEAKRACLPGLLPYSSRKGKRPFGTLHEPRAFFL
jgi:hypothetical protein